MKLSIITINLNNSDGLERTINSIFNQTYQEFEYLIIDGGSTDGSVDVIHKYSYRINNWVSEPDRGLYDAMNKGIQQANGEYVLFINSGDSLYSKDVLSNVFITKPKQDLVYGDLHRTFPDGHTDIVKMPDHISVQYIIRSVLTHPTTFIKKDLFYKYGFYKEDLKIVSDWAFFLKLIAFGNITQIHLPIVISDFEMNGLSSINHEIVSKERYQVINESFSPELNHICFSQEIYEKFYNKRIFKIIRYLKSGFLDIVSLVKQMIKLNFSFVEFSKLLYLDRRLNFIKIFNKKIRKQLSSPLTIPIIIINYNRLKDLKDMVSSLLSLGHRNIVIVDNCSTYAPLLEYYESISNDKFISIERMDKNYGHLAFWKNELLYNKFKSGFYIVTDSDIIPNPNLPSNYLLIMIKILNHYKRITKVGFALDIDEIPNSFKPKKQVIEWESQYWANPIEKDIYIANTDTTFALYYPYYKYDENNFLKAIRVAGDFTAVHRGWCIDSDNLSKEDIYYYKTSNNSNSWKLNEDGDFAGDKGYNLNK